MDPQLIREFLNQKTFAVVGSFRNETKYAYKIVKALKERGYVVYPVNPHTKEIEDLICYPGILDLPEGVNVADIVTPPVATEKIVQQCLQKGIMRIWMQPGAESEKAVAFCNENKMKVIYNACVMLGR